MKLKKLSICLPTYNRSKFVIEQLEFLKKEVVGYEDSVQIIVSDNFSKKPIVNEIKSFHKNNNFFKLFCQKENLGLIGNSEFLMNNSNSEFIWFIGDDDKLEPGILSLLFDIFKKHIDVTYIFFNHDCFKNNIDNIVNTFNLNKFGGYHKSFGDNMLKILNEYGTINMFMTSNVYKRDVLVEGLLKYDRKSQIDDFLIFSFICSSNGSSYIVPEIYVHDNYTDSTWSNSSRKIFSCSVPQRIIDIDKLSFCNNDVKNTLFIHYNKGRGNFIYMLFNSPVYLILKIVDFLGIYYSLRLFCKSIFLNIIRSIKTLLDIFIRKSQN